MQQSQPLPAWRWMAIPFLLAIFLLASVAHADGPALDARITPGLPVTLKADQDQITITLADLPVGLYSFYLHGRIDAAGRSELARVWKPAPMQFTAFNQAGEQVSWGRRLLKQSFTDRRMQGFHLHVDSPGTYTVRFQLLASAQETVIIEAIEMIDQLADLPFEPIKRDQNLTEMDIPHLETLSEQRLARDRLIWDALPPLNVHMQVHAQVAQFRNAPAAAQVPSWQFVTWKDLPAHRMRRQIFTPLDIVNLETGQTLTHEQVLAGAPLPDSRWQDDGTGLFFAQADYPDLEHDIYVTPWANMMGRRVQMFVGHLGAWDMRGLSLVEQFKRDQDPQTAHDGAMALVRVAYDWPALEMNLHEHRLNSHSRDFEYNSDWSDPRRRNGKYFYSGWSGNMAVAFMEAYDALFPYIQNNQSFADAVHEFIPWVRTPEDVIALLDQRLVMATVRDYRRNIIRGGTVEDVAGEVLGPHEATAAFFDLTQQHAVIYPFTGTFQELYATALNQSGHYHIGSVGYALGDARRIINKAMTLKRAREAGLEVPMDLSDVQQYPRVRSAADFLIDVWVNGGFYLTVGNTSGGTHGRPAAMSRLQNMRRVSEAAVELWQDPRHAWLLVHLHGVDDPEVVALAAGLRNPVLHNRSRVLPSWAGIIETNPDAEDLRDKTTMVLHISSGQGHAHHDYLDLNLYAMGLPLAVDLAQRDEGGHWTRPGASWSFLHNHALAHSGDDPRQAGNQAGEPWLKVFAPPLMRAAYTDQRGVVRLDRDVMLMQVGETDTYYAFDVQMIAGDAKHTWAFHGVESEDLKLNVPMRTEVVRWTDRLLPERGEGDLPPSQRIGTAVDVLEATWTATRERREYEHYFRNGGTVRTVALEPHVLGDQYDPDLPEVHVLATLLGQAGATVMSGKPFSGPYNYAFPFLWVQDRAGDGPTIYPAIYQWYRGDTPTVTQARLLGREPMVVEAVTSSGQTDTYRRDGDVFSAVSRDAQGVRFALLAGGDRLEAADLNLRAAHRGYEATVTNIDYVNRTFVTDADLPVLEGAMIQSDGRERYVHFGGQGRNFKWVHDLLTHEGRITRLNVVDDWTVELETNQRLFQAGQGNRAMEGFVVTSEDHQWHLRSTGTANRYRVIRRPQEGSTASMFTDANQDGLIHAKTYDIGLGDKVVVPSFIMLQRQADGGYAILTNVPVTGSMAGRRVDLKADAQWQPVR